MKKILSIILCLALVLSLAAVVSAAPADGDYVLVFQLDGKNFATGHELNEKGNKLLAVECGDADEPTWTVAACGAGVSLYVEGKGYLAHPGKTNVEFSETAYEWTLTDNGNGTFKLVSTTDSNRALSLRNDKGNYILGAYALSNETNEYKDSYCMNLSLCAQGAYPEVSAPAPDPEPEPTPDLPAADSVLTIPEANEVAVLAGSSYSANKYYVTGVITEIKNETYGNLYIADAEGNTLYLYGLYSADGSVRFDAMETKPAVGDTITVYTVLGTYKDAPQGKNAWMTAHTPSGEPAPDPEPEPTPELPAADSVLTIPEANAAAVLAGSAYSEGKYYVTGVITEIKNDTYGNLYIQDAEGNTLYLYGLYSADGSVRYDAMETKPQVGDTITVYTVLGTYKDAPQGKNAWMTAHTPAGSPETGDSIAVFFAMMAVSAMGIVVLTKKKF